MRWACMVSLVFLLASVGGLVAQGDKPVVKAISLEVQKDIPRDLPSFTSPYWEAHTSIGLIITVPGNKPILGIDEKKSELKSFMDDKKTDLKGKDGGAGPEWIRSTSGGMFSQPAKQASRLRHLTISGKAVPAQGATKVILKADVVFIVGSEEKTVEEKDFALTKDATVKLGDYTVSKGKYDDVDLTFKGNTFKSVTFLDAAGKEIKANLRSTGGGAEGTRWGYQLEKKVDKVHVKISYWSKIETLLVPVEVEVGLGF